ncbi:DUF1778 domain-containing protein [Sodalis ligni]|uniref:type II toxin-antitoxin system TacA family antitoxin n=1 Tax=Sodalis TaxID=84565 RepID=UPI00193F360B|nr:DUF1778 domain-containing protein [Sodalis ligni]QWA10878.1 DUF1778 domain-containing protein [Sodalis ligni]
MATLSHSERGRITARVSGAVQETLEAAAGILGSTLNQFIVQSALREAERVIEHERIIRLSEQEATAFLAALENPLPPNDALMAALQDYTARRNDQTGTFDWAPRPKHI